MDISEFINATSQVLDTGDVRLAKKLENVARDSNNPLFYLWLAIMYEPTDSQIDEEFSRRDKFHNKQAGNYESSILDNIENLEAIKDGLSSVHFFRLAFIGIENLAKGGDVDSMSGLSDMYSNGWGTPIDGKKSVYWRDKYYLTKTGMSFEDWLKNDT